MRTMNHNNAARLLVIVMCVLFVGCNRSQPTNTSTPTPTATPVQEAKYQEHRIPAPARFIDQNIQGLRTFRNKDLYTDRLLVGTGYNTATGNRGGRCVEFDPDRPTEHLATSARMVSLLSISHWTN